jgi:hypothetical protein
MPLLPLWAFVACSRDNFYLYDTDLATNTSTFIYSCTFTTHLLFKNSRVTPLAQISPWASNQRQSRNFFLPLQLTAFFKNLLPTDSSSISHKQPPPYNLQQRTRHPPPPPPAAFNGQLSSQVFILQPFNYYTPNQHFIIPLLPSLLQDLMSFSSLIPFNTQTLFYPTTRIHS